MMLNNYPDTFTFAQIHIVDAYSTPWGNTRKTFYGVTGTPTSWFDGVLKCVGAYTNVTQQYLWYRDQYLIRLAVPTDVTIQMTGEQVSGPTFEIVANVCIEPGGTGKTMRIYMTQLLDHWPASPSYSRNGFKQAATTEDVTLNPGGCAEVVRTFTFDAGSWNQQADIKILAWAQRPLGSGPAEVYQAAQMGWPFPEPEPVPAISEWGIAAMTLFLLTGGTLVLMRRRCLSE